MREYLFRGKDKETGEWRYGYLREIWSSSTSGHRFVICPSTNFESNGWVDLDEAEVVLDTVGQYTGLKDKAGVRIFEGDVVEHKMKVGGEEGIYKAKVFWSELCAAFLITGHPMCQARFMYKTRYYKIIGNIHDTPELLTGGGE
jgi:hypothetical protein